MLRGRTGWIALLTWVWACVDVGLAAALVPPFGMRGAAWAAVVAAFGLTLSYAVVSHGLWRVRYEGRRLAVVTAATVAFVLASRLLPELSPAAAVPLKVGFVAAFVGVLVGTGVLDRREATAARLFVRDVVRGRANAAAAAR